MSPARGRAALAARPGFGLYLHVPFCGAICSYCHFARTAEHDVSLRERTVAAMLAEFDLRRARCAVLREGRRPLRTVYLGGGTPSLLTGEQMARLLAGTAGRLLCAPDLEVTAEHHGQSEAETNGGGDASGQSTS